MKLNPYPEYKDSGVPFLGKLPVHWSSRKLRNMLTPVSSRNRPDLPLLSVVREKGIIKRDVHDKEENHNYVPDDLSNYKVVRRSQFVMNKMKAWQGSYGVSNLDGVVSPAYFVFDLEGAYGLFFHLAIRSKAYIPFFTQASDGVRIGQWDLNQSRMKDIPFFVPSLGEQTQIARFVDWKTSQINRFIRNKRKLIDLLQEQRSNMIDVAVLGGYQRNEIVERSGSEAITSAIKIPWLHNIPRHWKIVPAKSLFSVRNERARSDDQQLSATQAYGVIPQKQFEGLVRRRVVQIFQHLEKRRHVEPDDFVISMRSFQGGLERAWVRGCIRSSYVILKPGDSVDVEFFSFLLKSSRYIGALQQTSDFIRDGQDLNFHNFCLVDLPLVPLEEQWMIADYLKTATKNVDAAISRAKHEIELMCEYLTRLISDVVTGQVDVRGIEVPEVAEDDRQAQDEDAAESDDVIDDEGDMDEAD